MRSTYRPQFHRQIGVWLAASVGVVLLAACQTMPVYRPADSKGGVGYSEQQLAANRYRVSFSGGVSTHRNQVEDYLLRRSAEVTKQAGFTHFTFDDRDTEARTYYHTTFDPSDRWGWWRYGPRARFAYWSSWNYPFGWDEDVIPVTRYTAYAEIVTLTAAQAANNPEAIEADDVLRHLAPPVPPAPAGS